MSKTEPPKPKSKSPNTTNTSQDDTTQTGFSLEALFGSAADAAAFSCIVAAMFGQDTADGLAKTARETPPPPPMSESITVEADSGEHVTLSLDTEQESTQPDGTALTPEDVDTAAALFLAIAAAMGPNNLQKVIDNLQARANGQNDGQNDSQNYSQNDSPLKSQEPPITNDVVGLACCGTPQSDAQITDIFKWGDSRGYLPSDQLGISELLRLALTQFVKQAHYIKTSAAHLGPDQPIPANWDKSRVYFNQDATMNPHNGGVIVDMTGWCALCYAALRGMTPTLGNAFDVVKDCAKSTNPKLLKLMMGIGGRAGRLTLEQVAAKVNGFLKGE